MLLVTTNPIYCLMEVNFSSMVSPLANLFMIWVSRLIERLFSSLWPPWSFCYDREIASILSSRFSDLLWKSEKLSIFDSRDFILSSLCLRSWRAASVCSLDEIQIFMQSALLWISSIECDRWSYEESLASRRSLWIKILF
jgi:hypothetical protein